MRGNGHKQEGANRKFHTNARKNFTVRVTQHGSRLPGKVVESPPVEILKIHLETLLCNLPLGNTLLQGVGLDDTNLSCFNGGYKKVGKI